MYMLQNLHNKYWTERWSIEVIMINVLLYPDPNTSERRNIMKFEDQFVGNARLCHAFPPSGSAVGIIWFVVVVAGINLILNLFFGSFWRLWLDKDRICDSINFNGARSSSWFNRKRVLQAGQETPPAWKLVSSHIMSWHVISTREPLVNTRLYCKDTYWYKCFQGAR